MVSTRTQRIALWTLSTLLAIFFAMSAYGKLTNGPAAGVMNQDEQFAAWGFPTWFRIPVGLAELAAAAGLLVPRVRFYAASGLVLLMIGGVGTHLANAEWAFAPIPLVLAALAATVAWLARPQWVHTRNARAQPA